MPGRSASIIEHVQRMSPPRYTVSEAAKMIGRNADTLTRWRKQGLCVPSDRAAFGQLTVHLYTDDDIEALRVVAKSIRPGRKAAFPIPSQQPGRKKVKRARTETHEAKPGAVRSR